VTGLLFSIALVLLRNLDVALKAGDDFSIQYCRPGNADCQVFHIMNIDCRFRGYRPAALRKLCTRCESGAGCSIVTSPDWS
jgi:hypothetical protein